MYAKDVKIDETAITYLCSVNIPLYETYAEEVEITSSPFIFPLADHRIFNYGN